MNFCIYSNAVNKARFTNGRQISLNKALPNKAQVKGQIQVKELNPIKTIERFPRRRGNVAVCNLEIYRQCLNYKLNQANLVLSVMKIRLYYVMNHHPVYFAS